ncbi:MAG: sensor histidine kinase [Myxococcota bacterium]
MDAGDREAARHELERRLDELEGYYAELFSEVSHDLRAPLGVILGALGELEGEGMPPLDAEQRMLLRLVRRSAIRLSHHATDLLELSRIDANRLQLRPGRVDLVELLGEAVEHARTVEEGVSAEVAVEAPAGPAPLRADGARVTHALSNLVVRALRAARQRVTVRLFERGEGFRVEVCDDGAAVGGEELDGLLEHARRPTGELGRRHLGLVVAGELARALGGEARAERAGEGGGMRTWIELPRQPSEGPARVDG